MKSFFTRSLALLALAQSAFGRATPRMEDLASTDLSTRATGSINAVYFTNWLVHRDHSWAHCTASK